MRFKDPIRATDYEVLTVALSAPPSFKLPQILPPRVGHGHCGVSDQKELTGVTDPDATLAFTYDSGGSLIKATPKIKIVSAMTNHNTNFLYIYCMVFQASMIQNN